MAPEVTAFSETAARENAPPDRLLLVLQMQGLCEALRFALQANQPPGPLTIGLYNQLRTDANAHADAIAMGRVPGVKDDVNPVDLLSAAEVLRSTLVGSLTPQEHEEHDRAIGFSAGKPIE
jgi:hypothetical protein